MENIVGPTQNEILNKIEEQMMVNMSIIPNKVFLHSALIAVHPRRASLATDNNRTSHLTGH
jgi:hypothetical protein